MKRPLLIILGILFILVLLGVWVYMLLTGTPNNTDRFNEFGFGDTTDTSIVDFPTEEDQPYVDVTDAAALTQLTTKPVAGFVEVQLTPSSSPSVHYVESGTGHIYAIDLTTGEEERLSATTIPLTTKAALTPNGRYVLMQAGSGQDTEFIVGTLATTSDKLRNFALPDSITSFAATNENELVYTTPDGNNTLAKAYNPTNNSTRVLFTIPFRDTTINWNTTTAGPHLVYPKASSRLQGFVYSYTNGVLTRLPISGFGLSAVGSEESVIYSNITIDDGDYVTSALSRDADKNNSLPTAIIPEKCAFSPANGGIAVCGISLTEYSSNMPDTWYRGETVPADSLWSVQPSRGVTTLIQNVPETTGQTIDVVRPQFSSDSSRYYFQNKIDQTLWVYDFTK